MQTSREAYLSPGPTFLHVRSRSQRAAASWVTMFASTVFWALVAPTGVSGTTAEPVTAGPLEPPQAISKPNMPNDGENAVRSSFMVSACMHLLRRAPNVPPTEVNTRSRRPGGVTRNAPRIALGSASVTPREEPPFD